MYKGNIYTYIYTLEKQLGAAECESGNALEQYQEMCASFFIGKVDRRARKPWISQEMINKMDEQRGWKNVNNKKRKEELQKTEE